jgi:hypothetical protein
MSAALCLCLALDSQTPVSAQAVSKQRDGTLLIAGRNLRCGKARNVVDPHLPNLGLAAPGVLVMNPRLLNRWPASELAADCWAVKQGVRQGWLDRDGLRQVCRSFGNGPATSTHPSSAARCASLDRCFAGAVARLPKERSPATGEARSAATGEGTAGPAGPNASPKLLHGPTLKRSGMNPN